MYVMRKGKHILFKVDSGRVSINEKVYWPDNLVLHLPPSRVRDLLVALALHVQDSMREPQSFKWSCGGERKDMEDVFWPGEKTDEVEVP